MTFTNVCYYLQTGNGYITTDQLREILWELDNTITAGDMDQIIEEIDADDSGTVDFEGRLLSLSLTCSVIAGQ